MIGVHMTPSIVRRPKAVLDLFDLPAILKCESIGAHYALIVYTGLSK